MAKRHKDMAGRPLEPEEKPSEGHVKFNETLRAQRSQVVPEGALRGVKAEIGFVKTEAQEKHAAEREEKLRRMRDGR